MAGLRHNGMMVFQLQVAHPIDAVPLTRDYLPEAKAALARSVVVSAFANARSKSARQVKKLANRVAAE